MCIVHSVSVKQRAGENCRRIPVTKLDQSAYWRFAMVVYLRERVEIAGPGQTARAWGIVWPDI